MTPRLCPHPSRDLGRYLAGIPHVKPAIPTKGFLQCSSTAVMQSTAAASCVCIYPIPDACPPDRKKPSSFFVFCSQFALPPPLCVVVCGVRACYSASFDCQKIIIKARILYIPTSITPVYYNSSSNIYIYIHMYIYTYVYVVCIYI